MPAVSIRTDHDNRGQRAAPDARDRIQGEEAVLGRIAYLYAELILDGLYNHLGP